MNNLSLFLYAADVLQSLGSFLVFLAFISAVGAIFLGIGLTAYNFDGTNLRNPNFKRAGYGWPAFLVVLMITFGTMSALIPEKRTMYMIAASEMGEAVVQTPQARELFDELKNRVMKELKGESDTK